MTADSHFSNGDFAEAVKCRSPSLEDAMNGCAVSEAFGVSDPRPVVAGHATVLTVGPRLCLNVLRYEEPVFDSSYTLQCARSSVG